MKKGRGLDTNFQNNMGWFSNFPINKKYRRPISIFNFFVFHTQNAAPFRFRFLKKKIIAQ